MAIKIPYLSAFKHAAIYYCPMGLRELYLESVLCSTRRSILIISIVFVSYLGCLQINFLKQKQVKYEDCRILV